MTENGGYYDRKGNAIAHNYSRCEIWRGSDRFEIYFGSERDSKVVRKIYDWGKPEREPLFDYDHIPFCP